MWYQPNPFGLYDMLGNAWEWTGSLYKEDSDGSENKCAEKDDFGQRVIRGGSWVNGPSHARSANRGRFGPGSRYNTLGFRLVQD